MGLAAVLRLRAAGPLGIDRLGHLALSVPAHRKVVRTGTGWRLATGVSSVFGQYDIDVSSEAAVLLQRADGDVTLGMLVQRCSPPQTGAVARELIGLWRRRAVIVAPVA